MYLKTEVEPLLTVALCAISDARRAGEEDYSGKVAVFEYGTVKYAYLDKLDIGSYLAVGSQEQVLQAVESGRADLAVGPQDCLLYLLETGGRADDYTIVRSYLGKGGSRAQRQQVWSLPSHPSSLPLSRAVI